MGMSGADGEVVPGLGAPPPGSAEAAAYRALERLPQPLRRPIIRLLSLGPGRVVFRSVTSSVQIEIFDRSMTIAAQFFTSVFPILILLATWMDDDDTGRVADAVLLPPESRSVLDEAVHTSGGATFGVVGALIVFASATSLSRALTRAFAAVWQLPRPKSSLRVAWRWLAVVVTMALSLVVVRAVSGFASAVPPGEVWRRVVAFGCDLLLMVFVPWLLLSGAVQLRRLVPAAVLFAALMLVVRPTSAVWLPHALEVSADRYGSIGVAFTYLAWLYVVAFCALLAAVVGRAVTVDPGRIGAWARGETGAGSPSPLRSDSTLGGG